MLKTLCLMALTVAAYSGSVDAAERRFTWEGRQPVDLHPVKWIEKRADNTLWTCWKYNDPTEPYGSNCLKIR